MMTEEEVYEYAKTHMAIGISRSAFERAGVDPASLIGKTKEEQRRILHEIAGLEMGHGASAQCTPRKEITPEEARLNEALLEKLTAELGQQQGIEPWKPGRIVGAEYLEDDPEIVAFGDDVAASLEAHRPYMEHILAVQRKEKERDEATAKQKAAIMAEAERRYRNDPSRIHGSVTAPEAAAIESKNGWKPGEIEEV